MKRAKLVLTVVTIIAVMVGAALVVWKLGSKPAGSDPVAGGAARGQVIGWVTDRAGQPVPDCYVDRIPEDPATAVEDIGIITDADGRFEMRLTEGEWTVSFQCSTSSDKSEQPVTVRGDGLTEIAVEVPTEPAG
ncbi:MAG: hypothetical protein LBK95_09375 [Bifidobacteriaceae bacterium]|jgi:hypothetical protein|nr:hypothetical protein [Bifidobacteriaceae bacterium]